MKLRKEACKLIFFFLSKNKNKNLSTTILELGVRI